MASRFGYGGDSVVEPPRKKVPRRGTRRPRGPPAPCTPAARPQSVAAVLGNAPASTVVTGRYLLSGRRSCPEGRWRTASRGRARGRRGPPRPSSARSMRRKIRRRCGAECAFGIRHNFSPGSTPDSAQNVGLGQEWYPTSIREARIFPCRSASPSFRLEGAWIPGPSSENLAPRVRKALWKMAAMYVPAFNLPPIFPTGRLRGRLRQANSRGMMPTYPRFDRPETLAMPRGNDWLTLGPPLGAASNNGLFPDILLEDDALVAFDKPSGLLFPRTLMKGRRRP